ncbi:pentatricopeptide repeat-containing protein At4g18840-like [Selaginella moellendorffii]|uniref:pentatricopeptide repeat-containing protein At4g18840-like n=1 Tax=Selaginella moellendorffii TaxID=88036 RepID=UPI000D1C80E6|nr:pentatricopeptide repeat-containing protein At4g18840-like [Selaginella moellendorffii]|eukprot:XP_024528166.1 pentatricopeptide repeat-containing protein At4g18840-like [Selaginella moellendorffii]
MRMSCETRRSLPRCLVLALWACSRIVVARFLESLDQSQQEIQIIGIWSGSGRAPLEARFASHRNIKPRSGRWKEAIFNKSVKDAVEEEQQEKSPANVGKYASLIRSCTATQNLSDGRRLHHHIASHPNSKYRKDRFLGNLLVNMYGKSGCVDEARAVFDAIAHSNVFSWNMILAAYALNGHLDKEKSTFEEMPAKDAASWTCMIAAYGQVRQLFEARELFDSMQNPSVVPWNAIISAYAHAGHAWNMEPGNAAPYVLLNTT